MIFTKIGWAKGGLILECFSFTLTQISKNKGAKSLPWASSLGRDLTSSFGNLSKSEKKMRLSYMYRMIQRNFPSVFRGESTANKSRGSASRIQQHTAQKRGLSVWTISLDCTEHTYNSLDHQIRLWVYFIWAGLRNLRNCTTSNFVTWIILIIKFWLKKWKFCNLSKIQTKHAVNLSKKLY